MVLKLANINLTLTKLYGAPLTLSLFNLRLRLRLTDVLLVCVQIVEAYLLETSRVTGPFDGERNFHVLHLLAHEHAQHKPYRILPEIAWKVQLQAPNFLSGTFLREQGFDGVTQCKRCSL